MKLKLDARTFFFVLAAFNIVLVSAIVAVFMLASSAAQKKSDQIAQLKADNQTNDQLIGYYKVLQGTLNANKNLQSMVQAVLPTDKDQSGALAVLDSFSKNTNVPIQQISFAPGSNQGSGKTLTSPAGIKGVSIIGVSLTCGNTTYENLLNFLHEIESTQRRMQVATLNITPNDTNPDLLSQTTLTVNIYLKSGT